MRTPFVWTRPSYTVQVLCACCVFWGVPAAGMAGAATSTVSESTAQTSNNTDRDRSVAVYKRALALVAIGCVVGLVASWVWGGASDIRVRLINKPKKAQQLPVLVPPGPAPRLIPSESPNATRARPTPMSVPRQTTVDTTPAGITHYIAAFAAPAETSEGERVDYLLVAEDVEETAEPPDESGAQRN